MDSEELLVFQHGVAFQNAEILTAQPLLLHFSCPLTKILNIFCQEFQMQDAIHFLVNTYKFLKIPPNTTQHRPESSPDRFN